MAKRHPQVKVTIAEAVRDISITAINRGQVLPIVLALIAIIIILKLPITALENIVIRVFEGHLGYVSTILLIIVLLVWNWHAKRMRKQFSAELERVGREKSMLQNKTQKKQFKSSNGR